MGFNGSQWISMVFNGSMISNCLLKFINCHQMILKRSLNDPNVALNFPSPKIQGDHAFQPLGHWKPPQVFSQHTALALARTWDASGLGKKYLLGILGIFFGGEAQGIDNRWEYLMNMLWIFDKFCIYNHLHVLSLLILVSCNSWLHSAYHLHQIIGRYLVNITYVICR